MKRRSVRKEPEKKPDIDAVIAMLHKATTDLMRLQKEISDRLGREE